MQLLVDVEWRVMERAEAFDRHGQHHTQAMTHFGAFRGTISDDRLTDRYILLLFTLSTVPD
jgi:hypothetical protein